MFSILPDSDILCECICVCVQYMNVVCMVCLQPRDCTQVASHRYLAVCAGQWHADIRDTRATQCAFGNDKYSLTYTGATSTKIKLKNLQNKACCINARPSHADGRHVIRCSDAASFVGAAAMDRSRPADPKKVKVTSSHMHASAYWCQQPSCSCIAPVPVSLLHA